MEDPFIKILVERHQDLVQMMNLGGKFFILVPPSKSIGQNMVTRSFYENHIFFQSPYDEKYYVNLQGKSLELTNNTFQTYNGFKKLLNFTITDQSLMMELPNVQLIHVDNIVEENLYQTTVTGSFMKKENLRKCGSCDEYLNMFDSLISKFPDLNEINVDLIRLLDKLQINHLLIKGYIDDYAKNFNLLCRDFLDYLTTKLIRFNHLDNFQTIVSELCESLIFSKLYHFIFNHIKKFNSEEEESLKNKLQSLKSEFSHSMNQVDNILDQCKFKSSIVELKKISTVKTPFEKIAFLSQTYNNITKEINQLNEEISKSKRNKITINTTELESILGFIIINSDIDNIISEINFLHEFIFNSNMMNDEAYKITNLATALMDLQKKKDDEKKNVKAISINTYSFTVKTSNDVNPYDLYTKIWVDEKDSKEKGSFFNPINLFK